MCCSDSYLRLCVWLLTMLSLTSQHRHETTPVTTISVLRRFMVYLTFHTYLRSQIYHHVNKIPLASRKSHSLSPLGLALLGAKGGEMYGIYCFNT